MRIETEVLAAPRSYPHHQYLPVPRPSRPLRGLYPDELEACRRDLRRFLPNLVQLGLLFAVFRVYRIEGRAFQILVALALAALPVHYLLPFRWKKPFFVAVSIAGMAWVFGSETTIWLLAVATLLIGACFLPVRWSGRMAIVAAVAAGCALLRPRGVAGAAPETLWPVLGSIFMFRMLIYLYELKHVKRPESLIDTLCYFFLLPNFCFLHFPVIDYRTMQRGYFARDVHVIQRTGLQMMFRGTMHLLVYRLVYHELLISAEEVRSAASLAGYLVCNYLLYLRVSGQFHMACGLLHLFGFQLPETHRHYLLATGFTDYWRRINIYWKDFMVRVVFNPVVFRLKRRPQPMALAAATVAVFVTTWWLHAFQSYWLRGTWSFSVPDGLFWGILGVLVLVNVQLDARRPRGRSLEGASLAPRRLAIRAARTAATFTTMALLWSLWSSPSVAAWLGLLSRGLLP
jgi:D-alanyl-lipoteichoic acid acyltransferase DltB (MBOAT superfamily)